MLHKVKYIHQTYYKIIFYLVLLLLIALLIPMFIIGRYNIPCADDFSFSCETHLAIINGEPLMSLISEAINTAYRTYYSWQGTFSAVFFMALQPSVWGFRFYSITTGIMLVSLLIGIFFLCFRLFSGLFRIQTYLSGIIASTVSIICTQCLPAANESFYWFNGSVYYTFTFSLMLILFAVYIGYYLHNGLLRIIILCLLCILIGGSNYVTALLSCIILSAFVFYLIIKKDKHWLACLIPLTLLVTAFIISIISPGNTVRQDANPDHPNAIIAILLSFRYAAINIIEWTDLRLISCIIFLIPFIWAAASDCSIVFRRPVLLSLFSFCLCSAAFTPHIYALGTDGPNRMKNIIFFLYVLLLVLNLFWWCGWISHKKTINKPTHFLPNNLFPFLLCSVCSIIMMATAVYALHGTLSSALALNSLRTGEAQAYYSEAEKRQAILEDISIPDCEFEQFDHLPYLLFYLDITEDPDNWTNIAACKYYNKNSIVVK